MQYRRMRRGVFDAGIRLLTLVQRLSSRRRAAVRRCDLISDISYLPDGKRAHLLDICRPKLRRSMLPVLMYIHGGGFTMCSKETHRGISWIYADNGYLVFNVNYRLAPKYRYPAALEDIAAAWRWIIDNAENYGGDTSRIVVGGESAGGNLALALAVCACFRRDESAARMIWDTGVVPRVVLCMCGMLQVSDPGRLKHLYPAVSLPASGFALGIARDVSRAYLGFGYRAFLPETALADPLVILESDIVSDRPMPTVYAMAGTRDILLDDTRRLEKALAKRGIQHKVHYYPKRGHAFHLLGISPEAKNAWRENLEFLSREMRRFDA